MDGHAILARVLELIDEGFSLPIKVTTAGGNGAYVTFLYRQDDGGELDLEILEADNKGTDQITLPMRITFSGKNGKESVTVIGEDGIATLAT
jgi:hypothetical protein